MVVVVVHVSQRICLDMLGLKYILDSWIAVEYMQGVQKWDQSWINNDLKVFKMAHKVTKVYNLGNECGWRKVYMPILGKSNILRSVKHPVIS